MNHELNEHIRWMKVRQTRRLCTACVGIAYSRAVGGLPCMTKYSYLRKSPAIHSGHVGPCVELFVCLHVNVPMCVPTCKYTDVCVCVCLCVFVRVSHAG